MKRLSWLLLALSLVSVAWPSQAFAAGKLAVRAASGGPVLELARDGERLVGDVLVENVGDEPVKVKRAGLRVPGQLDSVRAVAGASVELEGREALLGPGQSRRAQVRWRPGPGARELYGHVAVEHEGGTVLVGVHGELGSALDRSLLAALIFSPLLVVLLALAARLRRDERLVREGAPLAALAPVGLAVLALARFDAAAPADSTHLGLQLVERVVLSRAPPLEWFVGADGHGLVTALALALVLLGATLALRASPRERAPSLAAGAALATLGLVGASLAQDGALLLVFLGLGFGATLVGIGPALAPAQHPEGGARRRLALAAVLALSWALLAAALVSFGRAAPAAPLGDGTASSLRLVLPELARVSWLTQVTVPVATPLGALDAPSFAKATFLLSLLSGAVLLPLGGLDRWLAGAGGRAEPSAAIVLVGALGRFGVLVVARFALGLSSDGARWAATGLSWVGLGTLVYGALVVVRARDLRGLIVAMATAHGGLALLALGSLTPQGIEGALLGSFGVAVLAPLALLLAAHFESVGGTSERALLRGLAAEAPRTAMALALALLGLAALPCSVGFWGPLLAVLGSAARTPALAVAAALAWALLATAAALALRELLRGPPAPELERDERLEPFGGRFPDLRAPLSWGVVGFALVAALLGLAPRLLTAPLDSRSLELHRRVDPPGLLQVG
jgi:NADH-quinone oxidoreductase subunit M